MRNVNGTVQGNLAVESDLQMDGTTTGSILVSGPALLLMNGTCQQDVVVGPSGRAVLNGTVVGNVVVQGGQVDIAGTIQGLLEFEHGDVTIAENAVVSGRLYSQESRQTLIYSD